MMKMVVVLLAAALVACEVEPESRKDSTNRKVPVDRLFTFEGCTVFRFQDGGRSHYYTVCSDRVATDSTYSVQQGKHRVTRTEHIETVER